MWSTAASELQTEQVARAVASDVLAQLCAVPETIRDTTRQVGISIVAPLPTVHALIVR